MSLFNLGKKDEYGKQRRIEHRGRHLRASRTGGVALRAQAKAAGVNVTANTSTGFRVSGTPMKNTQVALQNGRFVLRGRYGSGPTKLNVSKTGATVSTRNELGSFNWIKPNRSSAKVAGIQVRGKNAAYLQMVYMVFVGLAMTVQFLVQVLVMLFQLGVLLGGIVYRLALATPYALAVLRRRIRNARLSSRVADAEGLFDPPFSQWEREELIAAVALVLAGWGRGKTLGEVAQPMARALGERPGQWPVLDEARTKLDEVAARLELVRSSGSDEVVVEPRVVIAALASYMADRLPGDLVAETILQSDEFALETGARTNIQEQLLEVYSDFGGIRFQEPESEPSSQTESSEQLQQDSAQKFQSGGVINLNTATLEQLQSLPHLGPERARDVIAMRPITALDQLTEIDGIGPKRLEEIRAHGVTCS